MDDDLHERLATALREAGAPSNAAEADGTLCGIASAQPDDQQEWTAFLLDGLDPASGLVKKCVRELHERGQAVVKDLRGGQMTFQPVLPGDDAPLAERVAALASWSHGYLFGLSHGGVVIEELAGDAGEAAKDVGRITEAGLDAEGATEAEEAAFMEIVEFLRVATQIVFDEIARAAANGSGQKDKA